MIITAIKAKNETIKGLRNNLITPQIPQKTHITGPF